MVSIKTLLGRPSPWRRATAAAIAVTIVCGGLVSAPPAWATHASRPSPYFRQLTNIGPNGGHNFQDPGFARSEESGQLHFFLTPDFQGGDKYSRCPTDPRMELLSYVRWFGPGGAIGPAQQVDYRYEWTLNYWCGANWGPDGQIVSYGVTQPAGATELRFYFVYDNVMDGAMHGASDANEVLVAEARSVAPPTVPDAPSDLTLVRVQRDAAELNWQDNATAETEQQLQRSDDGRNTWGTVATLPADQTVHMDSGLSPGQTYWYRVRASNSIGDSPWSNELEVTPGCEFDTDCDGLSNSDETDLLLTNPNKPDTDSDGLLDPWESPAKVGTENIENAGFTSFTVPEIVEPGVVVSHDEVFGPYLQDYCEVADFSLRPTDIDSDGNPDQIRCFNTRPDPLHKDVFLELDWQDCREEGDCPEAAGLQIDPMHHAPSILGLALVRDMFADAPVPNPDGTSGVRLQVLVDEAISHAPNCDQGEAGVRDSYFGTVGQRDRPEAATILMLKARAVRYAVSGHSTAHPGIDDCPTPDAASFIASGFGAWPIEPYDWSPFGDANLGGRDILISLGPVWSCPSEVRGNPDIPPPGPCYRRVVTTPSAFGGEHVTVMPGIFPTSVAVSGDEIDLPYPVSRMLGLPERDGIAQLWGRALAHLLGHALGVTDADIRNAPDLPASDMDGDGINEIALPESYWQWTGLSFAPSGVGIPIQESVPRYNDLASQDLDRDGFVEGRDNCPGVPNVAGSDGFQPDEDADGFGDACDFDEDADGMMSRSTLIYLGMPSTTAVDLYPFDSDNDGLKNTVDLNDDTDAIADVLDNCDLISNLDQADSDADGIGNVCDIDDDADGLLDDYQAWMGLLGD